MKSIKELAILINAEIIGQENLQISAPNRIEYAQSGEITFLGKSQYLSFLTDCKASAIVAKSSMVNKDLPFTWLVVEEPYLAFAIIVEAFYPKEKPKFKNQSFYQAGSSQIHPDVEIGYGTYIGENSKMGKGCIIYPQVFIGNRVEIGSNTTIYPGVKILDDTQIGDNCIIHAGAVIGADGFGFTPQKNGSLHKIPQIGNVVIENDVEIGANTCIDRASLGSTIIKKGVKLDNLIQIGHNVQIGQDTVIAAQTGIAGSCVIGARNQIGGQAGLAPQVTTADDVKINAQSGVSKSILKKGETVTGTPAESFVEHYRLLAYLKQQYRQQKNKKDK